MKLFTGFVLVLAFVACTTKSKQQATTPKQASWAIKFADAVINESDSLIYYMREKPKYEYDYALLGSAMNKLGNIDKKYSDYNQTYIDYFVQEDGSINGHKTSNYNIDRIRPGLNMLELYEKTSNEKYKIAIEKLLTHLEGQPRTNSGGYWHKKVYPYQMWLDGLYMAGPFMARYAHDFNQPKWFDEAAFQLQEVYKNTLDEKTGLVYHAWDESKAMRWCNPETGQSKHFWSRGTGWYMMALVDILEYLPEDHPERPLVLKILNNLSEALLKVQDEKTGLWYQVLDMDGRERNYIESSGSAMIIYAFAKGAKNGYLDKKYLEIANTCFDNMIETLVKTGEDGFIVLTNACGAAGLGGKPFREADYNYYVTEKKVDNDQKAIGPLIMAAIELNK